MYLLLAELAIPYTSHRSLQKCSSSLISCSLCSGVLLMQVRPPMPPVYFFVIDVSVSAVNSGMVATTAAAIRSCLDSLPGAERTRIGFLTFDQHLHFYSLKASLSQPQMMVSCHPRLSPNYPHQHPPSRIALYYGDPRRLVQLT